MWKDKKLVPNPGEAHVRKLIYELFAKEKRKKRVARALNDAGYRTRSGARFSDMSVLRLIQDPTAKGLYRANHTFRDATGKMAFKPESEWVLTPVEPLITEELWEQCNRILEKRKENRPVGPKPIHLFAGILECGCGQKMYVFAKSPKYIARNAETKFR
jgi:site-specific DNA recombinase